MPTPERGSPPLDPRLFRCPAFSAALTTGWSRDLQR
jgi:hypothetical protein